VISDGQIDPAKLERFIEATAHIHSTLILENVLQAVVTHARELTGAHIAVLHCGDGSQLEHGANAVSLSEKHARFLIYDGSPRGLQLLVGRAGEPVRLTQSELLRQEAWAGFSQRCHDHPPINGLLGTQLVASDGRTFGVLYLSDKEGGEFSPDDAVLLVKLARIAAPAIEHARTALVLENRLRAKEEFIATMSHELRTPLSAMLGWTTMLLSGKLDTATANRGVHVLERSIKWQSKLIEDLVDTTRLMTGNLRLEVKHMLPAPIVEAAAEALRPAAEAKGLRMRTQLDRNIGLISGDPDRLQQVVGNLVSNSVKFTPAGGRIDVTLEQVGTRIKISVSDTGKGIPAALLPHVFERFRQADSSSRRSHSGLGLGLAIVRNLVQLHGGTVQAESAGVNQGAKFTVYLPVTEVAPGTLPARDSGELPRIGEYGDEILTGLRVLIVDDEPITLEMFETVLSTYGAEVLAVRSGAEALARFQFWNPNVLISDIAMPEMDGYDLIRKIRALPDRAAAVPALALSAYAKPEERERALASGFQKHLAKPIEPAKLVGTVAKLGRERTVGSNIGQ
jgi:signal transduction histidine kinase/ActR/RegA family two-component response regulator